MFVRRYSSIVGEIKNPVAPTDARTLRVFYYLINE